MIAGMTMALQAPRANPIQRAINILKSAGPGAWYDPSDLTTLFQDSAGTTPVTAVEQPVGLMLDKSQGLVLGAELVTNGTFDTNTAGWNAGNAAVLSVVSGKLRVANGAANYGFAAQTMTTVAGRAYVATLNLTKGTLSGLVHLRASFTSGGAQELGNAGVSASGAVRLVFTAASATTYLSVLLNNENGAYSEFDNISVRELPGNHLIQPTATSRPTLKQDGNGMYHLHFDGIDDSLYSAASVDFTSTDKMTVFAGVHKASDAAPAALVELSANALTTNGAFVLGAPFGTGTATYDQYVRGTVVSGAALGSTPAPATNVITAVGDIAGDLNRVTKNGTTSNQIGADQGTGNYGNYPLYIGRSNNSTNPFSGRIYQLAIKGKSLSAGEIATVESFINSRTKAY